MQTIYEIRERIDSAMRSLADDTRLREPQELYEPLRYMISMGGKRMRPLLCVLSYRLFGRDYERDALPAALGLELFHSFTLAHDDIMDNAEVRRGWPCLHKKFGMERAILTGDALCVFSYELMAESPRRALKPVLSAFSKTAREICEGQQMDISFERLHVVDMDAYLKMISLKTAVFVGCSAQTGALCGGATERDARALYDFGHALGMAFQICDDYLDTFGDSAVFGKNTGGDIVNNKKTWLLVEAFRTADAPQRAELERLMSLPGGAEKVSGVTSIYRELGIPEKARAAVRGYHDAAAAILDGLRTPKEAKERLHGYCSSLPGRTL